MSSIRNFANRVTGVKELQDQISHLTRINDELSERNAQLEQMEVWRNDSAENLAICRKARNDCWSKLALLQGPEVGVLSSTARGKSKSRKSHKKKKGTKRRRH